MHKNGMFRTTLAGVALFSLLLLLASCGGGGDDSGGAAGTTGTITLVADVTSIPADGVSSANIRATVRDSAGNPVRHYTDVTFTTTLGRFENGSTSYTMQTQPPLDEKGWPDKSAPPTGIADAALIASTTAGTAKVTVSSSGVTQSINIQIVGGLVAEISLSASSGTVRSDNSDTTTITAKVLDVNNAALKDTTVSFRASDGTLSAPSAVTDENGEATVIFSAGNMDKGNRISTITATSGTVSRQILITVAGTTLGLQTDYTNLEIEAPVGSFGAANDTATLTITATDAGKNPIYNAHLTVSVDPSSTGNVLLSITGGYTDSKGELVVKVTGKAKGNVIVRVEGLGTTATQAYTVGITGEIFSITSPDQDPYDLQKGENLTVVVTAPTQTQVIFATTCGAWDGGISAVVTKAVANKEASAVLNSSDACVATVQVYDADNPNTSDSIKVNIFLPADAASRIYLQAGAYVVAKSTGGVSNTVALEALVRDDSFQIVPNVPVSFSIADSTGGGEFVSPPLAYTLEGTGKAEATFTSGSMSSGAQGVTVNAAVVGKPEVADSIRIVIGGTAASVVIGQSTSIESINSDTSYRLPMTAQVVDSNGNPVPDARISLQLWPKYYRTGVWIPETIGNTNCFPEVTNEYPNEDDTFPGTAFYRNLILDTGEDRNGDGQLTPSSSAAGSLPAEVVADSTGVASFDLIYPKSSAVWILAELTASTLVVGSETRSKTEFVLPYLQSDAQSCSLPDSPYNTSVPTMEIVVTATPDEVYPDEGLSTSSIRALVTQLDQPAPDGTRVSFAIVSGTGGFNSTLTLTEIFATTIAGQAGVTYYSGGRPGDVTIRATLADGTTATVDLKLTRGAGEPFNIDLQFFPPELSADGGDSQSYVRADVTDDEGFPVLDNTLITFAIIEGSGAFGSPFPTGLNEVTTLTTAGIASVIYYSGSTPGDVLIRAQADNGSFAEEVLALVEVIGSMTLTASPASIPADGTSSSAITATIRDNSGNPVPRGTSVIFDTSLGTISTPSVTTPNDSGVVTVSLIAGNTAGIAVVTATATVGTTPLTQSTTVTIGTPIILLTAVPNSIDDGGTTTLTATVRFDDGTPVPGVLVEFRKADAGATTSLDPTVKMTDADGKATVTLTGTLTDPTAAGSTTVTATYGTETANVTIPITVP
ncbi:MAG: Ig-like domain-containing protein [Deltaproteobacteria bacterium]|nr:Ig-like domain-containing protein [Deltaproteobacteria bacterium]